ncbi:hypothetical protein [Absidia glauca]|uniref:PWWP domain-containing protein n=1 Tax=Absidia glauca TaxID=4829 RepID=A0A168QC95_ABSGL|nr:hypothetical protein [Absidia glauca]
MPSKSNGIIPDKEKPVYEAGEVVFAKLKGYPWWPAKIVGENQVPESVLKVKKKQRGKRQYTTYFYGSLDYAFFNSNLLRVFDPDQVRQAILDDKFSTNGLSEAIQDALDPNYLFDWEQLELEHTATIKGEEDNNENENKNDNDNDNDNDEKKNNNNDLQTIVSRDNAPSEQQQHTMDIPLSKTESTRTLTRRPKKRILDVDTGHKDIYLGRHKRKRSDTNGAVASPLSTYSPIHKPQEALLVKPKPPKTAPQHTLEYERIYKRIYLARHKLQKLIYLKKPGTIAAGDYPKIDSALKYIENCEMTKELLKSTKVGKVVRFGSGYVFLGDKSYNLQDRCLDLLKAWTDDFLEYHEHTVNITAAAPANGSIETTVANGDTKSSPSASNGSGKLDNSPMLMNNDNSTPPTESSIITTINCNNTSLPVVNDDQDETCELNNALTLPPAPTNSCPTIPTSKSLISTSDRIDNTAHLDYIDTKGDFNKLAHSSSAFHENDMATGCDLNSTSTTVATVTFSPDDKNDYHTAKTNNLDALVTIPRTIQPASTSNNSIGIGQLCEAGPVTSSLDNLPTIPTSPIITSSTATLTPPSSSYTNTGIQEMRQPVNTTSNSPASSTLYSNLSTKGSSSGSSAIPSLPTKSSTTATATSPGAQKPINISDMARNNLHDLSSIVHPTMERNQATTLTEASLGTFRNRFDNAPVGRTHYDSPTTDRHIQHSGFSAEQPFSSHTYNYSNIAVPPQHQFYGQTMPNYYQYAPPPTWSQAPPPTWHQAPPPTWSQAPPPVYHSNHTTQRQEQHYQSPFSQTAESTSPGPPPPQRRMNDSHLETLKYISIQERQTDPATQMTTPLLSNLLLNNNDNTPMIYHLDPTLNRPPPPPAPPHLYRAPPHLWDSGNDNRPHDKHRP